MRILLKKFYGKNVLFFEVEGNSALEIPLFFHDTTQKFRHLSKFVDSKSAVLYNAYDSISMRSCTFLERLGEQL